MKTTTSSAELPRSGGAWVLRSRHLWNAIVMSAVFFFWEAHALYATTHGSSLAGVVFFAICGSPFLVIMLLHVGRLQDEVRRASQAARETPPE